MEDTSAAYPHGSITGRSIVSVRFLITDIFLKSDRRTVCTWNFFRCKTDDSPGDDISSGKRLVAGSVVLILASFIGAMLSMGFVILLPRTNITTLPSTIATITTAAKNCWRAASRSSGPSSAPAPAWEMAQALE